jgi:hypothetical protein
MCLLSIIAIVAHVPVLVYKVLKITLPPGMNGWYLKLPTRRPSLLQGDWHSYIHDLLHLLVKLVLHQHHPPTNFFSPFLPDLKVCVSPESSYIFQSIRGFPNYQISGTYTYTSIVGTRVDRMNNIPVSAFLCSMNFFMLGLALFLRNGFESTR